MTVTESQPGTWSSDGHGVSASVLVVAGFAVSCRDGRPPGEINAGSCNQLVTAQVFLV